MAEKNYSGTIEKRTFAAGSKSEHLATVLAVSPTQSYRLRIVGEPSFQYASFEPFVGKKVTIRGELLHGNTLDISDLGKIIIKPSGPAPSI